MRDFGDRPREMRTAEAIRSICLDVYMVSTNDLSLRRGKAEVSECRSAICHYIFRETTWGTRSIAEFLGRDRTLVYHALKRYQQLLDIDRKSRSRARSIEARLRDYLRTPVVDGGCDVDDSTDKE